MDFNVNKICRVCLEEGVLTSLFSTDFAMMPSDMMMLCAKIQVSKEDRLPPVICNNCIYRLGVAYHFKQQCENSDMRLRQYLGLEFKLERDEIGTMTDEVWPTGDSNTGEKKKRNKRKSTKPSRYRRKAPEECKKRGPKTSPKVPQTCFECHKTFKCAAQLQMHIRTHTGDRPFACTFCPRRFAQKHNLAIHVRTHTGEKPFQCEICSKQFSARGNFQAHQKIHKGVRDQVCPVCNKGFISSGDLTRHMVTHTGIKNHHCDVCGKAFSRNRDMVNHKKKVHLGERPHHPQHNTQVQQAPVITTNITNSEMTIPEPVLQSHVPINVGHMHKCPASDCLKYLPSAGALAAHLRTHSVEPLGSTVSPHTVPLPLGMGMSMSMGIGGLGISHPQGTLGMMHPQRLHPF